MIFAIVSWLVLCVRALRMIPGRTAPSLDVSAGDPSGLEGLARPPTPYALRPCVCIRGTCTALERRKKAKQAYGKRKESACIRMGDP